MIDDWRVKSTLLKSKIKKEERINRNLVWTIELMLWISGY